jgi:hypothetical protein
LHVLAIDEKPQNVKTMKWTTRRDPMQHPTITDKPILPFLLPAPPLAGATDWCAAGIRDRLTALARHGGWWQGTGRYASISCCHALTVKYCADLETAQQAVAWIDRLACGHACQRWHALLDLATGAYIGPPMLERFCQAHPALVDVMSRNPRVVQRLRRGYRQVRFPAASRGMPWLGYIAHPTTWTFDVSDGTYRPYEAWKHWVDDLGLETLLEWLFWEVAARLPPRPAARMCLAGALWQYCPAPAARALVGSLHALLTGVVARCERGQARRAYLAAHPDAPRWVSVNAAALAAMRDEGMHHDPWCSYPQTTRCDCTKIVEQRALAGLEHGD